MLAAGYLGHRITPSCSPICWRQVTLDTGLRLAVSYMLAAGYLGHTITPSCSPICWQQVTLDTGLRLAVVLYVGSRLPWTQDYA